MTRIHMGSDSTLIAVASIPPRIWEQDKAIWKAWYQSKVKANKATMQTYKRYIADFYYDVNKPIQDVTEQDIAAYTTSITRIRTIRAYWKFAHNQPTNA